MNLASIYNKPNEDNSPAFIYDDINSPYAVDHMKYGGLEKDFKDSIEKIEKLNAQSKTVYIDLNTYH